MAAARQVGSQQVLQQGGHVSIRGVDLVHHQQAAREQGVAQMSVAYLEGAEQGLVDGADGDWCREKAFGGLGRPAPVCGQFVRLVRPQYLKVRQRLRLSPVGGRVAGQGAHHQRSIIRPQAGDGGAYALVELAGGDAGG